VRSLAKLPQDFTDLLIELCEADAEFLPVGGWAVILYGHVRATDDMDVFVRPSPENSQRVFAALEAFGAPLHAHAVAPEHFASEGARFWVCSFATRYRVAGEQAIGDGQESSAFVVAAASASSRAGS
jgi:hypothetical protein